MICEYCGNENPKGKKVCKFCGAMLQTETYEYEERTNPEETFNDEQYHGGPAGNDPGYFGGPVRGYGQYIPPTPPTYRKIKNNSKNIAATVTAISVVIGVLAVFGTVIGIMNSAQSHNSDRNNAYTYSMPAIELPDISDISFPEITMPEITVPTISIPEILQTDDSSDDLRGYSEILADNGIIEENYLTGDECAYYAFEYDFGEIERWEVKCENGVIVSLVDDYCLYAGDLAEDDLAEISNLIDNMKMQYPEAVVEYEYADGYIRIVMIFEKVDADVYNSLFSGEPTMENFDEFMHKSGYVKKTT